MTNIIVAFSKQEDAKNIKNILMRNGFQVVAVCTSGAQVLTSLEDLNSGITYLSMPLKVQALVRTLEDMCQSQLRRRKKLRQQPAERSREETQMIQEVKNLLMERNDMTEKEAHRYLQKCSMDSGTNLVETAQMVLSLIGPQAG